MRRVARIRGSKVQRPSGGERRGGGLYAITALGFVSRV